MKVVGYYILSFLVLGMPFSSAWAVNSGLRKDAQDKPEKKITICHYPPGNPENVQTLSIATSAWPAHKAHGDTRGDCTKTNRPKNSALSFDLTASLSAAAGNNIEICPGETIPLTITISGADATAAPWVVNYTNGTQNFEIITSQASTTVTVSESGTYSLVSIVDNNDNSGSVSGQVDLNYFDTPTAKMSGYANVCSGSSGRVTIKLTGTAPWNVTYTDGTSHYNFTTNNANYNFYTGAGSYALVDVSDAHCTGTTSGSATIIENPVSTVSITADSPTVCDGGTTTVTFHLTGAAPWTVVYKSPDGGYHYINTSETSYSITASAGKHSLISLSDANCCDGVASGSVTIGEATRPTATIAGNQSVCEGEKAAVTINLTGVAPWDITYTDGSQYYNVTSHDAEYTFDAPAGTYTLASVSDANCDGSYSGTATITNKTKPTATISGDKSICPGNQATIAILLTGTAPWNGTYTDGTNTIDFTTIEANYSFEASAGNYSLVSINDANCNGTVSGSASLVELAQPTAMISGSAEICSGETSIITIELTGSSPWNLTYSDGTDDFDVTTDKPIYTFSTSSGSYSLVNINDANCGGTVSGTATIINHVKPTASLIGGAAICKGEKAALTINLTGTAPWHFTYTDGTTDYAVTTNQAHYTFDALAGEYALVSVSDAYCDGTFSGTATITNYERPSATISGDQNICGGEEAMLTIALTGSAPWQLVYTNGTGNFNITTSDANYTFEATPGNYTLVSVTDANCNGTVSGSATITSTAKPTATISGNTEICEGLTANVTIEFTGQAPWNFTYTDGTSNFDITSAEPVYTFDANAGDYSLVRVSDANCSGQVSGLATIVAIAKPTAVMSGSANICAGQTATVNISLSGASPWQITYTNGVQNFDVVSGVSSYTFEAGIGDYRVVTISDANCEGTASGSASIAETSILTGIINLNTRYCAGDLITLSSSLPTNGTAYQWSTTGNGFLSDASSSHATYASVEDDGKVTFTLNANNACSATALTASTDIITAVADFEIVPAPENNELTAGLDYTFISPIGFDTYDWHFGDGQASLGASSTVKHIYATSGKYIATLDIVENGCSDQAQKSYTVIDNANLFIPNVISPTSSNPENSTVKVYGENISPDKFTFQIYNRWGLVVYQTSNLSEAQTQGWNGNTKKEENENNVFTYIVRGSFADGDPFEKTGTITLVK